MGKDKVTANQNRQKFLLTFFTGEGYEEKEVNGWYLVKHWNGNNESFEVAIYSKASYDAMKGYTSATSLFEQQDAHIQSIKEEK